MQAFVPKNRRPKFDLGLKIIDLNNVPLVSGTSYIKWHLPSSTSAEHRGRTEKAIIKDHKVCWNYEKNIPVRLVIDRNQVLQDCEINFEVLQEYASGAHGERIPLGNVKLNLAEYVEGGDEEDGITRRYLMQDSKINSTLKIAIRMKQIDGDSNFSAPPLKTARVFGGIAGIMNAEQGEADDLGHMSSMSSKTREISELQDMYRRTLAASWAAQPGELPADQCIENIFAGGDGWGKPKSSDPPKEHHGRKNGEDYGDTGSGDDGSTIRHHRRNSSSSEGLSMSQTLSMSKSSRSHGHARNHSHGKRGRGHTAGRITSGGVAGRTSIEQQAHLSSADEKRRFHTVPQEVDEFDVREDYRSWEISSTA